MAPLWQQQSVRVYMRTTHPTPLEYSNRKKRHVWLSSHKHHPFLLTRITSNAMRGCRAASPFRWCVQVERAVFMLACVPAFFYRKNIVLTPSAILPHRRTFYACTLLAANPIMAGSSIVVIDGATSGPTPPGPGEYSNRCTALTPTSTSFLERIGIWDHVTPMHHHPYQAMQVTQRRRRRRRTARLSTQHGHVDAAMQFVCTHKDSLPVNHDDSFYLFFLFLRLSSLSPSPNLHPCIRCGMRVALGTFG